MKCFNLKPFWVLALLLLAGNAKAQEVVPAPCAAHSCCANGSGCAAHFTPAGIMTDHLHPKGAWAFSYNYMNMQMQGNQTGTQSVSSESVLNTYLMAPTTMRMHMHMFMVMYGLSNRLTLMGMAHYNQNDMGMTMMPMEMMMNMNMPGMDWMMNMPNTCHSAGLGDTKLWALYRLWGRRSAQLIVAGGVNVPTGNIRSNGVTLLGPNTRLPYMMQLGTGTLDLMPALTFTNSRGPLFWGVNVEGAIPGHRNAHGYYYSPRVKSSAWMGYQWRQRLAASIRLEGSAGGKVQGYDSEIATLMFNDPCANAGNTGGKRAAVYLGFQAKPLPRLLPGAKLQFEWGMPFYQNLNGVQMRARQTVQAGINYAL